MKPFVRGDSGHLTEAAHDLGLSKAATWFWYNGWCLPNLYNLVRFCNYYEVSVDYVLGRTGVRLVAKDLARLSAKELTQLRKAA
jgi:hypothetical protein